MRQENIRNFSIIAHIDHGKSTLADRIIEQTGALTKREMRDQVLDSMDIERERGITIKLNAISLNYHYENEDYLFHLIDTPGHVDFSYEVSRSLASCEGALLVVDAAQGIEAQTLANLYLALDNHLTVLPVINKIDLPNADVPKVEEELMNLGFDQEDILKVSAKTGEGIETLLEAIVKKVPSPKGKENAPLRALIFDSIFDSYRGVLTAVRVVDGNIKVGDTIYMLDTKASYEVLAILVNTPKEEERKELSTGEVGYLYASIKSIEDVHVGDTITKIDTKEVEPLPGYKPMKSVVYCGLFPLETSAFEALREALSKLKLNDAALTFEPETSLALGFGFRCGFLGLLHMDVTIERIKREFGIDLIATSPSVVYEVLQNDGTTVMVDAPNKLPDRTLIKEIKEPFVKVHIYTPKDYIGSIMELAQEKRGTFLNMAYLDSLRVCLDYQLPLAEIVYDFFDRMKSITRGYASFDYEVIGYYPSDLVKLDILLNGEVVDALSTIVHKDFAYKRGKAIVEKLREVIPRQLFEIPIQASIGSKIIARTDIKALRKNVLAKCYGGDITRKKKLLEKQKEGKKRMKQIGSVEVPQEAFLAVLQAEEK
ncbi:MAG TPA: elongation factor 4 [Candidatus Onthousia faecigallinarum]|nr:elongation factor 4 [Candidatus Onthousia faecigallinarum]